MNKKIAVIGFAVAIITAIISFNVFANTYIFPIKTHSFEVNWLGKSLITGTNSNSYIGHIEWNDNTVNIKIVNESNAFRIQFVDKITKQLKDIQYWYKYANYGDSTVPTTNIEWQTLTSVVSSVYPQTLGLININNSDVNIYNSDDISYFYTIPPIIMPINQSRITMATPITLNAINPSVQSVKVTIPNNPYTENLVVADSYFVGTLHYTGDRHKDTDIIGIGNTTINQIEGSITKEYFINPKFFETDIGNKELDYYYDDNNVGYHLVGIQSITLTNSTLTTSDIVEGITINSPSQNALLNSSIVTINYTVKVNLRESELTTTYIKRNLLATLTDNVAPLIDTIPYIGKIYGLFDTSQFAQIYLTSTETGDLKIYDQISSANLIEVTNQYYIVKGSVSIPNAYKNKSIQVHAKMKKGFLNIVSEDWILYSKILTYRTNIAEDTDGNIIPDTVDNSDNPPAIIQLPNKPISTGETLIDVRNEVIYIAELGGSIILMPLRAIRFILSTMNEYLSEIVNTVLPVNQLLKLLFGYMPKEVNNMIIALFSILIMFSVFRIWRR